MEWIWDTANSVAIVATLIWAGVGFRHLAEENDQRKANIRKAQATANSAAVDAVEAKRIARYAKQEVQTLTADKQVIVPPLPDTPHNETLVNKLRAAANKQAVRRAANEVRSRRNHPAGRGRPATQAALNNPSYDFLPVAAVIAATDFGSSHTSSYSDSSSSSSSSSSSDSGGSFSGGDSGSF